MSESTPLDPRGQNMRDLSARTLDEVRLVPTETIKKALAALEKNLGGREVLASLLAEAAFTSDEEKFVAILGDPEESGTPLAKLLGVFGLSPGRFFKMLMDAKQVRSTFASMDHIYRRLPEVAEHTVERAIPKGEYVPEIEDVKLALQVGGLLKGGATTNVTLNQQVDARSLSMGAGSSSAADQRSIFKTLSQASDRVLYGRVAALPEGEPSSAETVGATKTFVDENSESPLEAEIVKAEG